MKEKLLYKNFMKVDEDQFDFNKLSLFLDHYNLGDFSDKTGIYFITPFIFCSKSDPHVMHLYMSLAKDTNIVG